MAGPADDDTPYQSLYRRFRPQRFADVLGQDHVTTALRNAVRDERVCHGYLFSGPRGTGKTSTARILAKALNCEKVDDGEPCGVCDSCVAVQQGTSFDAIELDAASNNGVEQMRDLIQRASLATTGRWKVYIVDEVHMLTTGASNALLKTLEEPPAHVIFVLATTDPQKVLPTIRSRVQHFEFRLLPNDVLRALVRTVRTEARLELTDDDLERVVRRGAGSGRDALSALDQAAALGRAEEDVPVADEVLEALCERDPGRALAAVAAGCAAGRDPRRLGEEVLARLRDAFLAGRVPDLVDLPPDELATVADQAARLGPAALVRAMERLGEALVDMREALDPRITLEVALVRVTAPEADASAGALLERIERLERGAAPGAVPGASASSPPAAPTVAAAASPARKGAALGALRKERASAPPNAAPAAPAAAPPAPAAAQPAPPTEHSGRRDGDGDLPTRDELTLAWGDHVLPTLKGRAKALYAIGRFVTVADGRADFALPNAAHRDQCKPVQQDVEAALAAHFGRTVPLRLVVDGEVAAPAEASSGQHGNRDDDDEDVTTIRRADLQDAPGGASTPADRVLQAFPGAEEVEE
jgi:DNA polymerase-3 subunit gamma/tau